MTGLGMTELPGIAGHWITWLRWVGVAYGTMRKCGVPAGTQNRARQTLPTYRLRKDLRLVQPALTVRQTPTRGVL